MGELFAHFKGWDVQAIRKEAREEAREEARKEVTQQVTQQVTEQVTQQVTEQITESDIQKLLAVLHNLDCSRETAIEQLMEQYQLSHDIAAAKADNFWERD